MPSNSNRKTEPTSSKIYEIVLEGHLDARWADWFDGFLLTVEDNGNTLLTGPIVDQSALHGVLKKVRDLGLTLHSLRCLENENQGDNKQ